MGWWVQVPLLTGTPAFPEEPGRPGNPGLPSMPGKPWTENKLLVTLVLIRDVCVYFQCGFSWTHSLPLFSFHPPWGVNGDSSAWWTRASFRSSGAFPPRHTITTLQHTHTHISMHNQEYLETSVRCCLKVSVNEWLTGSPLRPSIPSWPLSPCGANNKMAP